MKDKTTLQQLLDLAAEVEDEYDRVRELKSKSREIYEFDFRYEALHIHGPQQGPPANLNSRREKKDKPKNLSEALEGSFKKIRNALARELHPDLNQEQDTEEEFKDIQVAFEEGNLTKLLSAAEEYDVNVEVTNKDLSAVLMVIDAQRDYIEKTKRTLEWAWMLCSRKNSERQKVWGHINVSEDEFVEFLKSNNSNLGVLEAQTLSRRKVDWHKIEELLRPRPRKQNNNTAPVDAPTFLLT